MQTLLIESALRATLIAAVIALVLFAMRIKTASARHAVWASVVVLMMLLPAWVAWGPKAPLPVLPPEAGSATMTAMQAVQAPAAAPIEIQVPSVEQHYAFNWTLGVYLLGLCILLLRLAIGTIRASRLTSASCVVPVTVGLLHPRIILPERSHEWPQAQLDAVLAHEGEHIRRRDPLFQWIALLNRAIFWFHPLAWWLERKLSGLAEEACDAAVVARGYDPREYSEYLLDLARSVQRAGSRIDAVGMAMPGIGLKHRIRQMLSGVPIARISRPRMACTVLVCAIAAAILAAGTLVHAQQQSAPRPAFEVASIKPGDPNSQMFRIGSMPGGRFAANNASLKMLIQTAYDVRSHQISGGPNWLDSAKYDIDAKPDSATPIPAGPAGGPQMRLMLQSLLEERFKLKLHRESKEEPVYELMVARGGPKLQKATDSLKQQQRGLRMGRGQLTGTAAPMSILVTQLSQQLGRSVIDKTGLAGQYDFELKWTPDLGQSQGGPADAGPQPDPPGPSIFTAIQEQLGLRLESTKGPVDVLVIDYAEKPTEN
ncbi:MAG: TIGR03435 family protein [Acidobacteriia bacterium]|nr:TIGR03435 family protein [Terriglobia bacterium]